MILYPLYLSIPGHHMFPAFLSVPFVLVILSRPRWKSKLLKKGCMGWTWRRELVLLFVIKENWEINIFLLSCVGRKNFPCTLHENLLQKTAVNPTPPPHLFWIMTNPYQVLPGVPSSNSITESSWLGNLQ